MDKNKKVVGCLVKYNNPRNFAVSLDDLAELEEWAAYYMNSVGIVVDSDKEREEWILVHWPDMKSFWCLGQELIFIGEKNV